MLFAKNKISGWFALIVNLLYLRFLDAVFRIEIEYDLHHRLITLTLIVHQDPLGSLSRLSTDVLSAAHEIDEMLLLPPTLELAAACIPRVSGQ